MVYEDICMPLPFGWWRDMDEEKEKRSMKKRGRKTEYEAEGRDERQKLESTRIWFNFMDKHENQGGSMESSET